MAANPFDLTSRHALVTGCGSENGIGFASAAVAFLCTDETSYLTGQSIIQEPHGVDLYGGA